ncbi:MAG: hypothetical protein FJ271_24695 [Planctomycetes bacterium]|nr:hypothetical protein [Planctomycetota bacterium]
MAKVEDAREIVRNRVLAALDDGEREKFTELGEMLKNVSDNLTWHRAVGKFVNDSGLLDKVTLRELSWACGFKSDNSLGLRVQLCQDFTADQVKQLQSWQIPLGVVKATRTVKDAKKRWAALLNAKQHHWTAVEVRRKLRAKMPSPHPHGGRPRKKAQTYGAKVDLAELVRLSKAWLHIYEAAKTSIKGRKGLLAMVQKAAVAMRRLIDAVESKRQ